MSKDLAPLGVSADQGVRVSRPWTRARTSSDWTRAWDTFSSTLPLPAGCVLVPWVHSAGPLPAFGDTHWWKALSQRAPSTCRETAGEGRRFSRGEAGRRRQGLPLLHFPVLCALTSVFSARGLRNHQGLLGAGGGRTLFCVLVVFTFSQDSK